MKNLDHIQMDIFESYPNLPRDMKCEINKELILSEVKTLRLVSKETRDIVEKCLVYLYYNNDQVEVDISVNLVAKLLSLRFIDHKYIVRVNNLIQAEVLARHPKLRKMHIRLDNRSFSLIDFIRIFFSNYDVSEDFSLIIEEYTGDAIYIQSNNGSVYLNLEFIDDSSQSKILYKLYENNLNLETIEFHIKRAHVLCTIKRIPSIHALIITNIDLNWIIIENLLVSIQGSSIDTITINPYSYDKSTTEALVEYFGRTHVSTYPQLKRFLPIPISVYVFSPDVIDRMFPNLEIYDIDVTDASQLVISVVLGNLQEKGKAYQLWYH